MLRFVARIWAKLSYIWKLEIEAGTNELHAELTARLMEEKQAVIDRLNGEADAIDENIKRVSLLEEQGFWLCDNGHEKLDAFIPEQLEGGRRACLDCRAPAKFIKRSEMTGQEKYESDKERKDAADLAAEKRRVAEQNAESIPESQTYITTFRNNAENARQTADRARKI